MTRDVRMERFRGRVMYVDRDIVLLARGRVLLQSEDGGVHWRERCRLPAQDVRSAVGLLPLGARLTRSGFHHVMVGTNDQLVVFADKGIYTEDANRRLVRVAAPTGSRPLVTLLHGQTIYYGEYRGNPERTPVCVWRSTIDAPQEWQVAYRFEGVRHVHGVFADPFENALWVTTGDNDEECALWRTDDDFASVQRVLHGNQQRRAVQLLFTADALYFGSDAPEEPNHIYRLDRRSGQVDAMAEVGDTVFFGTQVGSSLFLGTTVEPSSVNTSGEAALWGSSDALPWKRLCSWKKDRWPMRWFQYGQIFFPSGPGDGRHLWLTPFATESHGYSIRVVADEWFD